MSARVESETRQAPIEPEAENCYVVTREHLPIEPNAENCYVVTREDLPLSCPMPSMSLWSSHPKVYLPVEETGTAKCPYCGAEYRLETS